ncbi:hypothetical protein BT69DRAFT_1336552 [Atractiella rhizophila]|nr:hypothetical protein BT69DRAFT_1336552 [Atractiella rhizophila]
MLGTILLAASAFLAQNAVVDASALTTTIPAHERTCFYAWVDKPGEKVGFYFAVQSGGSFDIDYVVTDPNDTIVLEGIKERQGDYIFTGHSVGEYSFCFSNDMSSFSEKLVDFDIMVESEPRPEAPAKPSSLIDHTSSLEESIYKLSGSLSSIQRTQKYFRTRENRNVSTVSSTRNRIFWFSVSEIAMMVAMSSFQVWVVRKFFNAVRLSLPSLPSSMYEQHVHMYVVDSRQNGQGFDVPIRFEIVHGYGLVPNASICFHFIPSHPRCRTKFDNNWVIKGQGYFAVYRECLIIRDGKHEAELGNWLRNNIEDWK